MLAAQYHEARRSRSTRRRRRIRRRRRARLEVLKDRGPPGPQGGVKVASVARSRRQAQNEQDFLMPTVLVAEHDKDSQGCHRQGTTAALALGRTCMCGRRAWLRAVAESAAKLKGVGRYCSPTPRPMSICWPSRWLRSLPPSPAPTGNRRPGDDYGKNFMRAPRVARRDADFRYRQVITPDTFGG